MPKPNKYHNKKVTMDGIEFDSRKEANRYFELKMLERAGEIQNLRLQVPFELIPTQREPDTVGKRGGIKRGKVIEKSCSYIADFVYDEIKESKYLTWKEQVVEDAKGMKTDAYVMKRKLMLERHGIRIREV